MPPATASKSISSFGEGRGEGLCQEIVLNGTALDDALRKQLCSTANAGTLTSAGRKVYPQAVVGNRSEVGSLGDRGRVVGRTTDHGS